MKRVIHVLIESGTMLSGNLAKCIERKYGLLNASARKIVSRSSSPIHKISGISFDKNQKYVYLETQFNGKEYFSNLFKAFEKSGKRYHQLIKAIQNNKGFIRKELIGSYVGAPIKNLRGHLRADKIIQNLISCKI